MGQGLCGFALLCYFVACWPKVAATQQNSNSPGGIQSPVSVFASACFDVTSKLVCNNDIKF